MCHLLATCRKLHVWHISNTNQRNNKCSFSWFKIAKKEKFSNMPEILLSYNLNLNLKKAKIMLLWIEIDRSGQVNLFRKNCQWLKIYIWRRHIKELMQHSLGKEEKPYLVNFAENVELLCCWRHMLLGVAALVLLTDKTDILITVNIPDDPILRIITVKLPRILRSIR